MVETIIKTIIGYVIPAVLGFLVAKVINNKKRNDGVKNGVMMLLQSNLTNTYYYYDQFKKIPDYIYKNFLNELKAYEDLNGDDYVHILSHHMESWEIVSTNNLKEK